MLPRIISIESVRPYCITTKWNTGETRIIDFSKILNPYKSKPDSSIGQLLNPEIFNQVHLDTEARTLYWEGLISMRQKDGSLVPGPLDFCPDVLFEHSLVI